MNLFACNSNILPTSNNTRQFCNGSCTGQAGISYRCLPMACGSSFGRDVWLMQVEYTAALRRTGSVVEPNSPTRLGSLGNRMRHNRAKPSMRHLYRAAPSASALHAGLRRSPPLLPHSWAGTRSEAALPGAAVGRHPLRTLDPVPMQRRGQRGQHLLFASRTPQLLGPGGSPNAPPSLPGSKGDPAGTVAERRLQGQELQARQASIMEPRLRGQEQWLQKHERQTSVEERRTGMEGRQTDVELGVASSGTAVAVAATAEDLKEDLAAVRRVVLTMIHVREGAVSELRSLLPTPDSDNEALRLTRHILTSRGMRRAKRERFVELMALVRVGGVAVVAAVHAWSSAAAGQGGRGAGTAGVHGYRGTGSADCGGEQPGPVPSFCYRGTPYLPQMLTDLVSISEATIEPTSTRAGGGGGGCGPRAHYMLTSPGPHM